jgi:hypothetical protein
MGDIDIYGVQVRFDPRHHCRTVQVETAVIFLQLGVSQSGKRWQLLRRRPFIDQALVPGQRVHMSNFATWNVDPWQLPLGTFLQNYESPE